MKCLTFLSLSVFIILPSILRAQVKINEVLYSTSNDQIELKNLSSTSVDVSTWWFCSLFSYKQISNMTIIGGSLNIPPGGVLALSGQNLNNSAADLGLYNSNSFSSTSAMQDFVQWGSGGKGRESVAVSKGIWSAGDFVPSVAAGHSIEYDGDGNSSSDWFDQPNPTIGPNAAPAVANPIEDRILVLGGDAAASDLNDEPPVFADPDGDILTYTVDSSDSAVATAVISGSTLTVTAVEEGSATITITAADPDGETASTSFGVVVSRPNAPPVVANSLSEQNLSVGDTALNIDLAADPAVFADVDGDALSYSAATSDPAVVSVEISGSVLVLTPLEEGSATITVTAADADGETASTSFAVVVAAGATPIQGDFNDDGKVDLIDFFAFAGHFGNTSESEDWDPIYDLVPSGAIDLTDFFFFAQVFGNTD